MSYAENPYRAPSLSVAAHAEADERAAFIRKTYLHLAGAVFAFGYILYDTSNVLHHYRIGQHVAASLALFASVALLFYYFLRVMMQFSRR